MKLIEQEVLEMGVVSITLGTAEFQAKPFYEKLGYEVVGLRKESPKGYVSYSLRKDLMKKTG
jgi:hypothetical protein